MRTKTRERVVGERCWTGLVAIALGVCAGLALGMGTAKAQEPMVTITEPAPPMIPGQPGFVSSMIGGSGFGVDDPLSSLTPIQRARAIVEGSKDFLPNGMPSSGSATSTWGWMWRRMSGGDKLFGDGGGRSISGMMSGSSSGSNPNSNDPVSLNYFAPNPTLRYQPGSPFDPGASGPGVVSRSDREPFLGGTFDPRSGWTVVILDHLRPNNARLGIFKMVNTYSCEQRFAPDTVNNLKIREFSPAGKVVDGDLQKLVQLVAGRPVFIQVHGSLTYADTAVGGGWWSHTWLGVNGALPEDAVFIVFNWPSWRIYDWDIKDINEKGRRAYIAGLHLAQFLSAFPPESRICLLGQSFGGRVVTSALHLLGGGELQPNASDQPIRLAQTRPDLHIRAIVLGAAIDHDWLLPDQKLGRAIHATEGFLNLHNPRDQALVLYRFLKSSGHKPAIGRRGMSDSEIQMLGPVRDRFRQMDVMPILGKAHSLLDATASAKVAQWIAPYSWGPGLTPDQIGDQIPYRPGPNNSLPSGLKSR